MAVVVAEHHRPHMQARGRGGCGGECAERGELWSEWPGHEVVAHQEHVHAAVFYASRKVQPGSGVWSGFADYSKPQRSTQGMISSNRGHGPSLRQGVRLSRQVYGLVG